MTPALTGGAARERAAPTVAVMQPYFLPYIGYFQLMSAVDVFVIYDHIKYTKKGWINRNRFLLNGADAMFSLPLHKASDALDVDEILGLHAYFEGEFRNGARPQDFLENAGSEVVIDFTAAANETTAEEVPGDEVEKIAGR